MDSAWQGTVLLADVRQDASKLYVAAGATKALQAIQECIALLESLAWAGGASVVRTTGDEMMAVFPAPAPAADAAAAMQAAVEALPLVAQTKLGVRIAFHSGPLIVRNGDVLGDTVNMASRLIEEALKEQIVTSRDTAAALDRPYKNRMRTLHPLQARNNAGALGLCEFVWRLGGETTNQGFAGARPVREASLRLKYGLTELVSKGEHHPVSLGRDFECGLIILDEAASRRHCTIESRAGGFVLVDHSTNGTFVTEEGEPELRLQHRAFTLRKHGWLAFGQPRANTDQVVEYSCA